MPLLTETMKGMEITLVIEEQARLEGLKMNEA